MDLILGMLFLAALSLITILFAGFIRYIWRIRTVEMKSRKFESGLFIDHGFTFSQKDGRAIPSKSPSSFAKRNL